MGKSYKHLSLAERSMIEAQLKLRLRPGAIAAGLQRARSTVTREIKRNGWKPDKVPRQRGRPRIAGGYRAPVAEQRARELSCTPRVQRKLIPGSELWQLFLRHLQQGLTVCWSAP